MKTAAGILHVIGGDLASNLYRVVPLYAACMDLFNALLCRSDSVILCGIPKVVGDVIQPATFCLKVAILDF